MECSLPGKSRPQLPENRGEKVFWRLTVAGIKKYSFCKDKEKIIERKLSSLLNCDVMVDSPTLRKLFIEKKDKKRYICMERTPTLVPLGGNG